MAVDTSSEQDTRSGRALLSGDCRIKRVYASSDADDWRCCEPPHYSRAIPPTGIRTADRPQITGGIIIMGAIIPGRFRCGSEFFEAMIQFAASAAGSRGRWWQGMADAARYARKDYSCNDPCYDPCPPYPYYCDPCAPPWSYCDPCEPPPCPSPRSYCDPCDPCEPQHGRQGVREEPDQINLKELRETLDKAAAELKLKSLDDGTSIRSDEDAEHDGKTGKRKIGRENMREAKAEAGRGY